MIDTMPQADNRTERQKALFDWVWAYTCERGYQPTYREIMEAFGIRSKEGVTCNLRSLTIKGWIAGHSGELKGQGRSIRFLRCPDGSPFLGFTARTQEDAING